MLAARLFGPCDMRVEDGPEPGDPGPGEALIRVRAVGVCGSDLHLYQGHGVSAANMASGLVLGHEFMGEVLAVGPGAADGLHQPLTIGQRVAVDPTVPCWQCEACETGNPNLCPHHVFYGLHPTDGALKERMIVDARSCFPMPDVISDAGGALLETLGVALHTLDLAKIKVGNSVAVVGVGPVGMLTLRLAKLAGAGPLFATDLHEWRTQKALQWGANHAFLAPSGANDPVGVASRGPDPVEAVMEATHGRGVDVAIEAGWADHSVQQAADMLRPGGRLVLVGIPNRDELHMRHSVARRKGLTIMMVRRMKHTYPRAIQLGSDPALVPLDDLISHFFPLREAKAALDHNMAYVPGTHKVIITP